MRNNILPLYGKKMGTLHKECLKDTTQTRMAVQWIISIIFGGLGIAYVFQLMKKQTVELERKNEEIVAMQQKLVVQDQLATLGQLMAGIAHEIKNPLNFVTNFSDLSVGLAEELKEELEKYRQRLGETAYEELITLIDDLHLNAVDTLKNGQRASNIVRSMMDHTRGTKAGLHTLQLNDLIEENVKLVYHGHRALDIKFRVNIVRNYEEDLPLMEGYSAELGRVLLNLLNNACYAVDEKRRQQVKSYRPTINVYTHQVGQNIKLEIRDNGTGIPPDVQDKIFDPFYTTKPVGTGNTGLGLSISKEVIEKQHGGRLSVRSELGKYTSFTILLPIESSQHQPSKRPARGRVRT